MLSNANYRSGKTVEIEGQDECLKTMKREERLLDRGGGDRRRLIITIERKDAVRPDCGSERAKYLPPAHVIEASSPASVANARVFIESYLRISVNPIPSPRTRSVPAPVMRAVRWAAGTDVLSSAPHTPCLIGVSASSSQR